jgi:hypothetical protein
VAVRCAEGAQILHMDLAFFSRCWRGVCSRKGQVELPFDSSPQVAQMEQLSSTGDGRKKLNKLTDH